MITKYFLQITLVVYYMGNGIDIILAQKKDIAFQSSTVLINIEDYEASECPDGFFGKTCIETCGNCADKEQDCDTHNGHCFSGCAVGWKEPLCKECTSGFFGETCENTCGNCLEGKELCDSKKGYCYHGCEMGWKEPLCKERWMMCNDNKQTWSEGFSECITKTTLALFDLLNKNLTKEKIEKITVNLNIITSNSSKLQAFDIELITRIMENISNISILEKFDYTVLRNGVMIISNILSVNDTVLRNASKIDNSTNRLIIAFEKIIDQTDTTTLHNNILRISETNVVISIQRINQHSKNIPIGLALKFGSGEWKININSNISLETMDAAITLQDTFINEIPETLQGLVSFVIYKNSKLFQETSEYNEAGRGSVAYTPIITARIGNSDIGIKKLHHPIRLFFRPQMDKIETLNFTATCSYWNFTGNNNSGSWSSYGCVYNGTINNSIVCLCDHLTHFAVLLDIKTRNKITDDLGLEIVSYIGCALSIIGLTFSLIILLLIRKLTTTAGIQTFINLIIALLFTMIIFVAGIQQTQNKIVCIAVAMLLHYFLLVSFFWMLMEGIIQYNNLVRIIQANRSHFIWKSMLFSWGIPAIIIGVTASVDYSLYYGGPKFCWLSRSLLIYGLVCPVGIVLSINTVIFTLIIQSLFCRDTKIPNSNEGYFLWLKVRGVICTMFLTGLTWFFGIFSMIYYNIVFQYLFCIFNSSQGFFIAIFFYLVLINKPEWKEFKVKYKIYKNEIKEKKLSNATSSSSITSKFDL